MENLWNKVKNSKTLWVILSILILVVVTTIGLIYIFYFSKTTAVSSNQNLQNQDNLQQENTIKLEDLQDVSEMTEEELKKTNEKELEEAKKKEEKKNTNTSKSKYYIKVNYGAQLIDVYTYDTNGNYTKRVKTFICSTGTATPTSGVYKIPAKVTWLHMFGDVFGHYCTQIVGNILFHLVPYLVKGDPSTLEYWEYDKLGTKASMGCIRMTTRDALWIFNNVSIGTPVEFYSDSSQAYRRPSTQKISDAPSYLRGWDPTDPNPDNPWKDYKPEKEEDKNSSKPNTKPEDEEKPNSGTTKPEQETKPDKDETTKPSNPSEEKPPVEEKPEDPEKPTEPEESEEPQEPENPTNPDKPDEPEEVEPPETENPDGSDEEENGQSGNLGEGNNQNTENIETNNNEKNK